MNIVEDQNKIYALLNILINKSEDSQEQLNIFIDEAIQNNDYSFLSGLTGVGWVLSFLNFQKIISEDTDELLFDFDDNLYKIAIKIVVESNPCLDELLDILTYFQQRFQNKTRSNNYFRTFSLFEIIKLLTVKLCDFLESGTLNQLDEIKILLKLSYLSQTCINERKMESIFYSKTEELIESFKMRADLNIEEHYYLRILQLSSVQFNNPFWVNQIENILAFSKNNHKSKVLLSMDNFIQILKSDQINNIEISSIMKIDNNSIIILLLSDIKRIIFDNANYK